VALMAMIKEKLKGHKPIIAAAPERGNVVNLMDALKASLGQIEAAGARAAILVPRSDPCQEICRPDRRRRQLERDRPVYPPLVQFRHVANGAFTTH
jgi:hypothetical protein